MRHGMRLPNHQYSPMEHKIGDRVSNNRSIIKKEDKMVISTQEIKRALKEVLAEENAAGINPMVIPPLREETIRIGDEVRDELCISTSEAIGRFSEIKRDSRLKVSTE